MVIPGDKSATEGGNRFIAPLRVAALAKKKKKAHARMKHKGVYVCVVWNAAFT